MLAMLISAALRGPIGRTGGGPAGIPVMEDLDVEHSTLRLKVQTIYQTYRKIPEV